MSSKHNKEKASTAHRRDTDVSESVQAPQTDTKPKRRAIGFEDMIDAFVILILWAFLLNYFTPDLMLSRTTTTGGDMGSHYALSHYLETYLIPHGKLIGWYPHWLAGDADVPVLLYTSVSYDGGVKPFISPEVAFKVVSVSGIFLLPVFTYISMRLMGFRFPAPAIAACFSLMLLFLETYSQWGVNIKSTLAGQFPHGISFAFAFLSLGLIYYGTKHRKYLALNAVILSIVIMTHIYTPITIAATLALYCLELLLRRKYAELRYVITAGILAMLISGFWLIPLFAKLKYSSAPRDIFFGFPDFNQLFISGYAVFYLLALFCIISPVVILLLKLFYNYILVPILGHALKLTKADLPDPSISSFLNLDERLSMLYYYTITAFLFFLFSNHTHILYVRFLPILYFTPLIFAAVGLAIMTDRLRAKFLVPVIVVFLVVFWIGTGFSEKSDVVKLISSCDKSLADSLVKSPYLSHGLTDVPNWIKWNYEGLEKKPGYQTFKDLMEYFKTTSPWGV